VERLDGDAHADKTGAGNTDKWPSSTYEQHASERSDRAMNATGGSSSTSGGANQMVRCIGPDKRPCTEGEVKELTRRLAEKTPEHPELASISTLTLESKGAMSCRQIDGALCSHEQLRALNQHVAEPLRCAIYEVVLKPNSGSHTSTAQNQTSTSSGEVSTTSENESSTQDSYSTPDSTSTTPGSAYTMPSSSSTTPNSTYTPPSGTSTTAGTAYTTSSNSSTTAGNSSTTSSGTSTTQHKNSTAQNHSTAAGTHSTTWHHRTNTTQNHTTTAATASTTTSNPH
jgi:hypothetical protein